MRQDMRVSTYQLKQQTPMIHFQSDEEGATLRASEVKPKLDKFLLEQLGGVDTVRKENPDWFVSEDHPALNYKLRFAAKGNLEIEDPHKKLYFGNMGINEEEGNKRKTVYYQDRISMNIICFDGKLQTEIHHFLPYFFVLHAFGTRNGKGFGCFSLENVPLDINVLKDCCPLKTFYSILYKQKKLSAESFLNDIWIISSMMKSGFNFTFLSNCPHDYYKGHIFRYFIDKGIGGDKAFIKQKVLINRHDQDARSEEKVSYNDKFRFVRAMLGLPGSYKFNPPIKTTKTTRRGEVIITSANIERFQSPVQYRVQNNQLFIIPQHIPKEMLMATFYFQGQKIHTPEEFDLIDFLDSFCLRFNTREDISKFRLSEIKKSLIIDKSLKINKIGDETK